MDKTEILAEAMRLIDEHTKACWANNFAAAACTQESIGTFLREHLAGQAIYSVDLGSAGTYTAHPLPPAAPVASEEREYSELLSLVGDVVSAGHMNQEDLALFRAHLGLDAVDRLASIPLAAPAQETVSKKEAIHMINALIAGESLPKDSLVLLDDLCHYASRDQDQDRAQLVAALEEIASMTYDSWTNGARAGEIARAVLKKDKDG